MIYGVGTQSGKSGSAFVAQIEGQKLCVTAAHIFAESNFSQRETVYFFNDRGMFCRDSFEIVYHPAADIATILIDDLMLDACDPLRIKLRSELMGNNLNPACEMTAYDFEGHGFCTHRGAYNGTWYETAEYYNTGRIFRGNVVACQIKSAPSLSGAPLINEGSVIGINSRMHSWMNGQQLYTCVDHVMDMI